jgi:hypothetical protein
MPAWCDAIMEEVSLPRPDDYEMLSDRFSQQDFEFYQMCGHLEEMEPRPKGVARLAQPPVTAHCLSAFLGLELPAALRLSRRYGPPVGFVALRACLYLKRGILNSFDAHVAFDGLQLYADGRIGTPVRFARMDDYRVQRRTLGNAWYPFSFEGEIHEAEPENSWLPTPGRQFWLSEEYLLDSTGLELRRVSL